MSLAILRQDRSKIGIVVASIITAFLFFNIKDSIADPISIKGSMKTYRKGSYAIIVNYETRDKSTDNILFRIYCEFEEGELIFTSSIINNVGRGLHKVQLPILRDVKRKYGSLRKYEVSLYQNGVLVDTKQVG